jgi:hypothetical protein
MTWEQAIELVVDVKLIGGTAPSASRPSVPS